jgi:hypothetical protein
MSQAAANLRLTEETLAAYTDYLERAESAMAESLHGDGPFLWSEGAADRAAPVREGRILAQFWSGKHPLPVPGGLIHDWIGAASIPGATIEKALAVVQDYDNHKSTYKPEVLDSKLLSRDGDNFEAILRLLKHKIVTVVLDTFHSVQYTPLIPARWYCRSRTTRIAEIENPGKATEFARLPDTGHGFLWRLCSYWRFEQLAGDVHIECRAISLTRDVPDGLGWLIEPIIKKLPKESLIATLQHTRDALMPEREPSLTSPAVL